MRAQIVLAVSSAGKHERPCNYWLKFVVIGGKGGTRFVGQSQRSKTKPTQSRMTFNARLENSSCCLAISWERHLREVADYFSKPVTINTPTIRPLSSRPYVVTSINSISMIIFVWKVCVKLFLRMGKKFKKQCKEKKCTKRNSCQQETSRQKIHPLTFKTFIKRTEIFVQHFINSNSETHV